MDSPYGKHVGGITSSDVDYILCEQVLAKIFYFASKKEQMRSFTERIGISGIESFGITFGIATCRRKKADFRSFLTGQSNYELSRKGVMGFGYKTVAAKCNNMLFVHRVEFEEGQKRIWMES